jgi:transposase
VVLEACYGWYWAADTLAAGAEVHLAHPLGVKAFACRRVKNDELDARDLAGLLRMGRLAEAWIAPPEIRELREITRYLLLCRTRHNQRIHGELLVLGIKIAASTVWEILQQAGIDPAPKRTVYHLGQLPPLSGRALLACGSCCRYGTGRCRR